MTSISVNNKTAQLITSPLNDRVFLTSDRMGTFGPSSGVQQYYYPTVQSFNDKKEFYFCVKSSAANPNQVITPSQLFVKRDNDRIIDVNYDKDANTDTKLYVIYKSAFGFADSKQPNNEYIITECRGINLETLTKNGKLCVFNDQGKEELIYLCYSNEESFFSEIETCGINFLFTISTLQLAAHLKSGRRIFSN